MRGEGGMGGVVLVFTLTSDQSKGTQCRCDSIAEGLRGRRGRGEGQSVYVVPYYHGQVVHHRSE